MDERTEAARRMATLMAAIYGPGGLDKAQAICATVIGALREFKMDDIAAGDAPFSSFTDQEIVEWAAKIERPVMATVLGAVHELACAIAASTGDQGRAN